MKFLATVVIMALAALPAAAPLRAQTGNSSVTVQGQPGQPAAPAPAASAPQEETPLRLRVTEVSLPVTVRDPRGQLAWNLGPEDFRVYDDGVLQHIMHFDMGGDPLSVVLVVESSSRIKPLMAGIRSSGIVFTQSVMGANGRGAVIGFDETPKVLVPFTADPERIQKAVSKLQAGDDGARLYDAMGRALEMLSNQPENRRRVLVVVSQSIDTGSTNKLGGLLRDAQLENVAVYTVGLSTTAAQLFAQAGQAGPAQIGPPGTFSRPGVPGVPQTPSTMAQNSGNIDLLPIVENLVRMGVNLVSPQALEAASVATGGAHLSVFHPNSIQEAIDRIGGELHAEYTLAYQAPVNGPYGYHQIIVKVTRPGYHVRTRPGYFLSPPSGSTTSTP
ncbi:MAG TPA: VWA domain-containing protein [Candidatus Dormibacteraeota bacterium]|nr:VWA domain-containing protein [Candidatus Dormibacteraeota bacterium]